MFQYARIPSLLASFDALSKFFWLICVAVLVFIYPPHPILSNELGCIRDAQRLRGLRRARSLRGLLRFYGIYLMAVLLRSLRKAQVTAFALDSKAFGAYRGRTYLNPFRWTVGGLIWLGLWVLLVGVSLYAAFVLRLWSGHYFAY